MNSCQQNKKTCRVFSFRLMTGVLVLVALFVAVGGSGLSAREEHQPPTTQMTLTCNFLLSGFRQAAAAFAWRVVALWGNPYMPSFPRPSPSGTLRFNEMPLNIRELFQALYFMGVPKEYAKPPEDFHHRVPSLHQVAWSIGEIVDDQSGSLTPQSPASKESLFDHLIQIFNLRLVEPSSGGNHEAQQSQEMVERALQALNGKTEYTFPQTLKLQIADGLVQEVMVVLERSFYNPREILLVLRPVDHQSLSWPFIAELSSTTLRGLPPLYWEVPENPPPIHAQVHMIPQQKGDDIRTIPQNVLSMELLTRFLQEFYSYFVNKLPFPYVITKKEQLSQRSHETIKRYLTNLVFQHLYIEVFKEINKALQTYLNRNSEDVVIAPEQALIDLENPDNWPGETPPFVSLAHFRYKLLDQLPGILDYNLRSKGFSLEREVLTKIVKQALGSVLAPKQQTIFYKDQRPFFFKDNEGLRISISSLTVILTAQKGWSIPFTITSGPFPQLTIDMGRAHLLVDDDFAALNVTLAEHGQNDVLSHLWEEMEEAGFNAEVRRRAYENLLKVPLSLFQDVFEALMLAARSVPEESFRMEVSFPLSASSSATQQR